MVQLSGKVFNPVELNFGCIADRVSLYNVKRLIPAKNEVPDESTIPAHP
jgi:hypothetical protein